MGWAKPYDTVAEANCGRTVHLGRAEIAVTMTYEAEPSRLKGLNIRDARCEFLAGARSLALVALPRKCAVGGQR